MSLQGAWRFEEGSGTTSADMSGNGLPMTQVPGWTANGHTGGGIAINGTTQGAATAVSTDFNFWPSSTFMCWVRFNTFGGSSRYIMYGPRYAGVGAWGVYTTASGQLVADWGSSINGPILSTDTWYHIALAVDWAAGSQWSNSVLYVNGVEVASGEGFPFNSGDIRWGGPTGYVMNGIIDDARWDSAQLTQAQIQAHMNTPVPGPLEGSGTTRFLKGSDGEWKPMRTRRIVGDVASGTVYGWQLTKHNTGLNKFGINGERLPLYTGSSIPPAGARIYGKWIKTGLDLSNGDIVVERCFIQPEIVGEGHPVITTANVNTGEITPSTVTIRDCTIDGSLLDQYSAAMCGGVHVIGNIIGNYISGFGSGIAVIGAGDTLDGLVEGNYVTGLIGWGDPATNGNHSDGFTVRDFSAASTPGRQLIVQNNRFDCQSGNDTGACFIQAYSGNIDNVTIQGNLLEGGGYNMALEPLSNSYSNIRSINNRFNPLGYGAYYVNDGPGWTQWTDNYINAPGQPDNRGAVVN